jgi:cytochrome c oxidase assembly protein subunit 15
MNARRLSLVTLLATVAVMLWGAFVRATGSGAGCGAHWPLCNGVVVPRSPQVATLIEMTHRLTSGLLLVLAVVLAVVAWRGLPRRDAGRRASLAALVLLFVEAAIGAGLVLFELVGQDRSLARAVAMGAHLVNTFLLLAALSFAVDWTRGLAAPATRGQGIVLPLLAAAGVLLLVLGASGGVTALGDTLFPAGSLAEGLRQDASPTAHVLIRLRVLHPVLAVVFGAFAAFTAAVVAALRPAARRRAVALVLVVLGQLAFGVVNLVLLAPVWAQLTHLLLADLCVIALARLAAAALAEGAPRLVLARTGTAGAA